MPHNSYKPVTVKEPYDPKQRIVGAVVLFLIILIIYGSLKLLLGMENGKFVIPSKPETETIIEIKQTGAYNLPQKFVFLNLNGNPLLQDSYEAEEIPEKIKVNQKNETKEENISLIAVTKSPETEEVEETEKAEKLNPVDICTINLEKKQWYLQVASFKDEKKAQNLVQEIKKAKLLPKGCIIFTSNGWYAVHLPPETDYSIVQSQLKRLYKLLHLKGLIRKIDGT